MQRRIPWARGERSEVLRQDPRFGRCDGVRPLNYVHALIMLFFVIMVVRFVQALDTRDESFVVDAMRIQVDSPEAPPFPGCGSGEWPLVEIMRAGGA